MPRKDEMEILATKKAPPGDGGRDNGARKSPSAANKALITRNLRLVYGEIASEPLPPHLLELLNRIDEGEDKS